MKNINFLLALWKLWVIGVTNNQLALAEVVEMS